MNEPRDKTTRQVRYTDGTYSREIEDVSALLDDEPIANIHSPTSIAELHEAADCLRRLQALGKLPAWLHRNLRDMERDLRTEAGARL